VSKVQRAIDVEACIVELCREAGVSGSREEIVERWEADHACCCNLHVGRAVRGDESTMEKIRECTKLASD
jgi:hypothetical protein